mgnify:CR=1 FL=1
MPEAEGTGASLTVCLPAEKEAATRPAASQKLPKRHKGELKTNFITPYILSPHDSKTLYLAGNYVFRSTNRGDSWIVISDDLSHSSDPEKEAEAAGAIQESHQSYVIKTHQQS